MRREDGRGNYLKSRYIKTDRKTGGLKPPAGFLLQNPQLYDFFHLNYGY
jgi:hypothetical protein